ncbi:uncharacterized protein LOC143602463 [Bidens hawaiensis]|uniref:uncharacterized protein LOC143602463 n=1 Tax=Bidens hawaiensis TaxID=980011 RepID=UPI0040495897
MAASRELKRNLLEVYDVDEYEGSSATKARNTSQQGRNADYLDHGDQSVECEVCHAKLWPSSKKMTDLTCYFLCCHYGKVELPDYKQAPQSYQNLFTGVDRNSNLFMKNIRRYNSMFSFTSMGGKIDKSINRGNAPPIFRLSGQNYHSLGSLLLVQGSKPKFSQLYIYDTDNEISNRKGVFSNSKTAHTSSDDNDDTLLINYLKSMLDSNNVLVQTYRMLRDYFQENPQAEVRLCLIGDRQQDGRAYNLPTSSEVATLIVGDIGDCLEKRDIIVNTQEGLLKRISELHPSYLPLQNPIFFPYGDDGYRVDIYHRVGIQTNNKRDRLTMREFFAYRIQDRTNNFSLITNGGRLYQQFLVDGYTSIESERLFYIRCQQKNLRCESYEKLVNLHAFGSFDISTIGQRVILPSSFTGGARYMRENYLDAMALCKWFGYPDFFITMTCN